MGAGRLVAFLSFTLCVSACGGSDPSSEDPQDEILPYVADYELLDPGTGEPNAGPLLPMMVGTRTVRYPDDHHVVSERTVVGGREGRVVQISDGGVELWRSQEQGWARYATQRLWDLLPNLSPPILLVPHEVRVGMKWRSANIEFEVESREVKNTLIGERTVWQISGGGNRNEFMEDAGILSVNAQPIEAFFLPAEDRSEVLAKAPTLELAPLVIDYDEESQSIESQASRKNLRIRYAIGDGRGGFALSVYGQRHEDSIDDFPLTSNSFGSIHSHPEEVNWSLPKLSTPKLFRSDRPMAFIGITNNDNFEFKADTVLPWVSPQTGETFYMERPALGTDTILADHHVSILGGDVDEPEILGPYARYFVRTPWEGLGLSYQIEGEFDELRDLMRAGALASTFELGPRRHVWMNPQDTGDSAPLGWLYKSGIVATAMVSDRAVHSPMPAAYIGANANFSVSAGRRSFISWNYDSVDESTLQADASIKTERLGTIPRLPEGEYVTSVNRIDDEIVVTTIEREVPLGVVITWRTNYYLAPIPSESVPAPGAPAATVSATVSGSDMVVCWQETHEPLSTSGWTLGGVPASAVLPVQDGRCALVVRDLQTALPPTELGGNALTGEVPGVGLMTIGGPLGATKLSTEFSNGKASQPSQMVELTSGFAGSDRIYSDAGLPQAAEPFSFVLSNVGYSDAGGHGKWKPIGTTEAEYELVRPDGTSVRTGPYWGTTGASIISRAPHGGIVVGRLGGVPSFYYVAPDASVLDLPEIGVGVSGITYTPDGRQCGKIANDYACVGQGGSMSTATGLPTPFDLIEQFPIDVSTLALYSGTSGWYRLDLETLVAEPMSGLPGAPDSIRYDEQRRPIAKFEGSFYRIGLTEVEAVDVPSLGPDYLSGDYEVILSTQTMDIFMQSDFDFVRVPRSTPKCAATSCDAPSDCDFGSDVCVEMASSSGTCALEVGADCSPDSLTYESSCVRDTTGQSCAADTCTAWSACAPLDTTRCDAIAGERARTCTSSTCGAGSCEEASTPETESCDPGIAPVVCTVGNACDAGYCAEDNCSNGVDDDGQGGTDCDDPACDGKTCAGGGTCVGNFCLI